MPASRTVTRQRFSLTVSTLSHAFSTLERIGDQLTALLAHEFQHVVELASREDVVDPAAFAALYRRIGYSSGERSYETEAAQEVERRVLTELFAANRASRRARARDRESRRAPDGPDRAVRRADPPPASPRVPCPE
jgi:hypothetical protein